VAVRFLRTNILWFQFTFRLLLWFWFNATKIGDALALKLIIRINIPVLQQGHLSASKFSLVLLIYFQLARYIF
jgi:hypothetical protein